MTLYSDNDSKICAWLSNLVREGFLPDGEVRCEDIRDTSPDSIPDTFHAFAGIGGWALAAKMAGWPGDRPIWTASCPCQPFSRAGQGKGVEDSRHLWPALRGLIEVCRPPTIVGEQVAGKLGREWCAGVRSDLEALGYAVGIVCLPACAVGAPHRRERMWWVALSELVRCEEDEDRDERNIEAEVGSEPVRHAFERNAWEDSISLEGKDGIQRRVPTESAFLPLAPRLSSGMVRLRGYGNAIVPQLAAEVIRAIM